MNEGFALEARGTRSALGSSDRDREGIRRFTIDVIV